MRIIIFKLLYYNHVEVQQVSVDEKAKLDADLLAQTTIRIIFEYEIRYSNSPCFTYDLLRCVATANLLQRKQKAQNLLTKRFVLHSLVVSHSVHAGWASH
jgi:hypothetical protein